MRPPRLAVDSLAPGSAVFVLSAAIIGLELALMRCLSVASWHHFAYLVLSTALLGFGASGTVLCFVGRFLDRRFESWSVALTLAFALSVPLCFRAAQALPLDPQYLLYSGRQICFLILYHLLLFVPFLLGATVIGLALMHFGGRVHGIYGANLLGSGTGGALMLCLMSVLPETALLGVDSALILVAAAAWTLGAQTDVGRPSARRSAPGRRIAVVCTAVVVALLTAVWPPTVRIDPYKSLAVVRRYEAQSDAERLLTKHGPRGRLDVYASPLFHDTLFAGFTAPSVVPASNALRRDTL